MKKAGFVCVSVLLLGYVVLSCGANAPARQRQAWEYGQLVQVEAALYWHEDSQKLVANQATDAIANLQALATKMDSAASPQLLQSAPQISVFNALGKQGWELASEDGARRRWLFERPR